MKKLLTIGSTIFLLTASATSFAASTEASLDASEHFNDVTGGLLNVLEVSEFAAVETAPVKNIGKQYYKGQDPDLIENGLYEDFSTIWDRN